MENLKVLRVAKAKQVTTPTIFDNQIAEFLSSDELAIKLGVSVHTVRKWRKLEIIPYRKFGRSVRFLLKEVREALEIRN